MTHYDENAIKRYEHDMKRDGNVMTRCENVMKCYENEMKRDESGIETL